METPVPSKPSKQVAVCQEPTAVSCVQYSGRLFPDRAALSLGVCIVHFLLCMHFINLGTHSYVMCFESRIKESCVCTSLHSWTVRTLTPCWCREPGQIAHTVLVQVRPHSRAPPGVLGTPRLPWCTPSPSCGREQGSFLLCTVSCFLWRRVLLAQVLLECVPALVPWDGLLAPSCRSDLSGLPTSSSVWNGSCPHPCSCASSCLLCEADNEEEALRVPAVSLGRSLHCL